MREIVKFGRRGENIYYTPLSERKHHLLIDDMNPEKVLQLQKDGFKPAVFLESSPGNYQCILTFPKFQGDFDREICNPLAVALNKRYGDPKLSGAVLRTAPLALRTSSQSISERTELSLASA